MSAFHPADFFMNWQLWLYITIMKYKYTALNLHILLPVIIHTDLQGLLRLWYWKMLHASTSHLSNSSTLFYCLNSSIPRMSSGSTMNLKPHLTLQQSNLCNKGNFPTSVLCCISSIWKLLEKVLEIFDLFKMRGAQWYHFYLALNSYWNSPHLKIDNELIGFFRSIPKTIHNSKFGFRKK